MKNVYYVLGVVILMSCGNNPKTNQLESDLSAEKVTVVKENLDSSLVKGILELVESKEGLNSPNTIVRTEIYHIKDRTENLFKVNIPQYASDYNILFYKPLHESFIIKDKKIIQESNKVEYFLEIPK